MVRLTHYTRCVVLQLHGFYFLYHYLVGSRSQETGVGVKVAVIVAIAIVVAGVGIILTILSCLKFKGKANIAEIFAQDEHVIPRDYVKKDSLGEQLLLADPMEFPRFKLRIFEDRILGKITVFSSLKL